MASRVAKQKAQEMLMHGIGDVLGYWTERNNGDTDDVTALELTEDEFSEILQEQADRVAHMFGYVQAWGN